jgi:hypothetical protein
MIKRYLSTICNRFTQMLLYSAEELVSRKCQGTICAEEHTLSSTGFLVTS